MLQQTQVDRVLPKCHEWLERYPRWTRSRGAPEDEVTRTWCPARLQHQTTPLTGDRPRSRCSLRPPSVDEPTLRSFKGIGAYTAGAIRSFAFRQRAAILDTNVARVLFRVFVGSGDPKAHAMRRRLWQISGPWSPRPGFRFQSGPHGFRRDRLHGAQARLPCLSDGIHVRSLPVQSGTRTTNAETDPQNGNGSAMSLGCLRASLL